MKKPLPFGEIRVMSKTIYYHRDQQSPPRYWFYCDDDVYCSMQFVVTMSEDEAAAVIDRASKPRSERGLIQDILTTHTADERELFVSGLTGPEFDNLFGTLKERYQYKNLMVELPKEAR